VSNPNQFLSLPSLFAAKEEEEEGTLKLPSEIGRLAIAVNQGVDKSGLLRIRNF
jgi:hypothetical protein